MEVCTLIEMRNGSRQIQYTKETVAPSMFIRQWQYVALTPEKIEEIKTATTEDVQKILKTL